MVFAARDDSVRSRMRCVLVLGYTVTVDGLKRIPPHIDQTLGACGLTLFPILVRQG